jgi:hypothetical protein
MAAAASRPIELRPSHLDATRSKRELKRSSLRFCKAGQKKSARGNRQKQGRVSSAHDGSQTWIFMMTDARLGAL